MIMYIQRHVQSLNTNTLSTPASGQDPKLGLQKVNSIPLVSTRYFHRILIVHNLLH